MNKRKSVLRALSLMLAVLLFVPVIALPATAAEGTELYREDFSDFSKPADFPSLSYVKDGALHYVNGFDTTGETVYWIQSASKTWISGTYADGKFTCASGTYDVTEKVEKNQIGTISYNGTAIPVYSGTLDHLMLASAAAPKTPLNIKDSFISFGKIITKESSPTSTVVLSWKYYLPADAKGGLQSVTKEWDYLTNIELGTNPKIMASRGGKVVRTNPFTTDAWNEMRVVYDLSTGKYDVFVNGSLAVSDEQSTAYTKGMSAFNPWHIPRNFNNSSDASVFNGTIGVDDIRVTAATEDEIAGVAAAKKALQSYAALTPVYAQKTEGTHAYLHVPYVKANYDKATTVKHNAVTEEKQYIVMEANIRFPQAKEAYTSQIQFAAIKNNGVATSWVDILLIRLDTGTMATEERKTVGGQFLFDTWNNLKLIIDRETATYRVELNGETTATEVPLQSKALPGFTVDANKLLVTKCNKTGTYTDTENENTAYIDFELVNFETTDVSPGAMKVTVDGKEINTYAGAKLNLADGDGQYLYAEITPKNGETSVTTEPKVAATDGMTVVTHRVRLATGAGASARLKAETGLRFRTAIDKTQFNALQSQSAVKSITIGTLIAPLSYVQEAKAFTREALETLNHSVQYADVIATAGYWFEESDNAYTFAGSLVNLKESHYAVKFAGIGYLTAVIATAEGEKTVTLYSDYAEQDHARSIAKVAHLFLNATDLSEADALLRETYREILQKFADRYVLDPTEEALQNLKNYNVLAIGDSLFGGHNLDRVGQWLNLVARQCGWNLTNLGVNGWTVAYNPGAYPAGASVRGSMYDKLKNDANYRFGSTSYGSFNYSGKTTDKAEDVDLIFLEGGVNDYNWGIPLGTTDSKDPSTVLGAYNCMVEMLLKKYPNATIIFITTWERAGSNSRNPDGLTTNQFLAGMKNLYNEKYATNDRVKLIDAGDKNVSGVDMDNAAFRAEYGNQEAPNDQNHLGAKGMQLMCEKMLPLIWQVLKRK